MSDMTPAERVFRHIPGIRRGRQPGIVAQEWHENDPRGVLVHLTGAPDGGPLLICQAPRGMYKPGDRVVVEVGADAEEKQLTAVIICRDEQRSTRTGERIVPVLYLDIDGTVRHGKDELGRFVNGPDDVTLFPEVYDLLRRYKAAGWRIVGVSNQGGIALGFQTIEACYSAMVETQRRAGGAFDKIAWCSHHPDSEDPEMRTCWCRKPRAGLIIEAALALAEHHDEEIYPPHLALMVGDRPEDAACAEAANVPFLDAALWRAGNHIEQMEANRA